MHKRTLIIILVAVVLVNIVSSCSVQYNFTGGSPMVNEKTFTVYYFPNRARLINPTLAQSFTEELRERLTRQTSLDELAENGDVEFEGQIESYDFRPMSIAADDQSAQTRLTISVKVKYTNHKTEGKDLEQTFTAYEDFDSSLSISSVEDELVAEIIEKLVDDIFNATIINW